MKLASLSRESRVLLVCAVLLLCAALAVPLASAIGSQVKPTGSTALAFAPGYGGISGRVTGPDGTTPIGGTNWRRETDMELLIVD